MISGALGAGVDLCPMRLTFDVSGAPQIVCGWSGPVHGFALPLDATVNLPAASINCFLSVQRLARNGHPATGSGGSQTMKSEKREPARRERHDEIITLLESDGLQSGMSA